MTQINTPPPSHFQNACHACWRVTKRVGRVANRYWNHPTFGRFINIALLAFIIVEIWRALTPQKPEIGPYLRRLADEITPRIVSDLRALGPAPHVVAVLHLGNDPSDYLTDALRSQLQRNNIFDLADPTLGEKLRESLGLRQRVYDTLGPALTEARRQGAQGVLFGRLNVFDSDENGDSRINLELKLADVRSQQVVFSHDYTEHSDGGTVPILAVQLAQGSRVHHVFAWLVIVLLLPVFTISFIRSMVRRESNRANGVTLGIYTAADALLGYLLIQPAADGLSMLLFAFAVTFAFLYNVHIMTAALRLET